MTEEIREICRAAIRAYGTRHQMKKAIEEMGELIAALMRFPGRSTADDVITEIADVLITASQLALMFGESRVTEEVKRKIERLRERAAEAEKQKEYYGN